MAHDPELSARLRDLLADQPGVEEGSFSGGRASFVGGHVAVSAGSRGELLLRVDPADTEELLADPRAEPFVMRGRELAGWLLVHVDGTEGEDDLGRWVTRGLRRARSLPPKA